VTAPVAERGSARQRSQAIGRAAVSAFPELSARTEDFDATCATSTRAVTVASWLGVAAMAGTCIPLARVFQSHITQAADARHLAIALAGGAAVLAAFLTVVVLTDGGDLRAVVRRVVRA
jgi:hypothetical protein